MMNGQIIEGILRQYGIEKAWCWSWMRNRAIQEGCFKGYDMIE